MRTLVLLSSVLVSSVLVTGCARNAALEIELTVPPQPAAARTLYAVVQLETDAAPFEDDWRSNADYPGTELGPLEQAVRYSVLSENPETVVQMKVLFCRTPTCTAEEDAPDRVPAVWYRLERSLYVGERTWWRPSIQAVPLDPPTMPVEVDKCEIEGCIEGGAPGSTFCRLSGEHFCEG